MEWLVWLCLYYLAGFVSAVGFMYLIKHRSGSVDGDTLPVVMCVFTTWPLSVPLLALMLGLDYIREVINNEK